MESRLAYTAGSMVVVASDGSRKQVPAGACVIDLQSERALACTIRWSEFGIDCSGQIPAEALRAYLLGCVVQYA
ncbi:MAG TPA: hypothetical protein VMV45_04860 [Casimicrobiaceae bacterium]|nr:hypothetical protein [Casimicrobiaceae bacterium]